MVILAMAKKFPDFEQANSYVMDKDSAINSYINYMLARTQSMFAYTGLPDTIPARALERLLQTKGYCFIVKHEGALYALYGGLGGEVDVYGEPTQITISNTALKLSKTYDIETDGVLIQNDSYKLGLLPILKKYGALLTENTLSMRTVDVILRMVCLISASDDKTHTSAEKFISDIENGKISAVGESAFFEGVRIHSVANTQSYLTQFRELEQYLKVSCFNEIGLNGNWNAKREYIGSQESALNDDFLLPLVDDMIKSRQEAIDRINEKYGTEISIDYASAWAVTHAENEKQIAIAESVEVNQGDNIATGNSSPVEGTGSIGGDNEADSGSNATGRITVIEGGRTAKPETGRTGTGDAGSVAESESNDRGEGTGIEQSDSRYDEPVNAGTGGVTDDSSEAGRDEESLERLEEGSNEDSGTGSEEADATEEGEEVKEDDRDKS